MCWNNPAPRPSSSSAGPLPPGCLVAPCACAQVDLTARLVLVRGLQQPGVDNRAVKPAGTTSNSSYVAGYTSADDHGRIFTNTDLDGNWQKDHQAIELTVQVDVAPAGCRLPPGTLIEWTIEDPDDPSNQSASMHEEAGRLIDPNDYAGPAAVATAGDNDPRGHAGAAAGLATAGPAFALAGNRTPVDGAFQSKVKFNVIDVAGANYRITARAVHPSARTTTPASTGVMTVWHRIRIEYVKMASALELPVDQIASHYDIACVQVDVGEKRVVSGAADKAAMGADDASAYAACNTYASSAGEFRHEGQPSWFFMAAAKRYVPGGPASILYEGPATVHGDHIRLPAGPALAAVPAVVRVFNPAQVAGLPAPLPNDFDLHIKFPVDALAGRNIFITPHDFHAVNSPDTSFLDADLATYGFANGSTMRVQVMSAGEDALVTSGISPGGTDIAGHHYFAGKLLVFTQNQRDMIATLCHELCHAFDNAHKCGNFDHEAKPQRTACCMNYWFQFVLDRGAPRRPLAWTQNRGSANMCGEHIVSIRDYHLEDNPGLGW